MNCCGTHGKKEGEEKEGHEHDKEEHSHSSHAGCGMHGGGGGWLYWILVGTFIYLVVAYIFTYVL